MKIVKIENQGGRLMVEIDTPSSDGLCRIMTKEEVEENDRKLSRLIDVEEERAALAAQNVAMRKALRKVKEWYGDNECEMYWPEVERSINESMSLTPTEAVERMRWTEKAYEILEKAIIDISFMTHEKQALNIACNALDERDAIEMARKEGV